MRNAQFKVSNTHINQIVQLTHDRLTIMRVSYCSNFCGLHRAKSNLT